MKQETKNDLKGFAILLALCYVSAFIGYYIAQPDIKIKTEYIYLSDKNTLELTPQNVYFWCNQLDIKCDSIVVAQSILETGWYKSKKCIEDNNIFGLQHSTELSFVYGHWLGSLIRYKRFQDTYYKGGDYYQFLDSVGYAEDELYVEKLKLIVKQNYEKFSY
jgi:hypothetical protein